MKRNIIALALGFVLSAWMPHAARSQQAEKVPRIGWLQGAASTNPIYESFRQGLKDLGYVEGKNVELVIRSANGSLDHLPDLVKDLIGAKVDMLLVGGEQGLRAAKDATSTIPILVVVCDSLDSLTASIARPGGKATGLTCLSSEIAGKRLQLLKEIVPAISRVAVLYNPEDQNKPAELNQMRDAAQKLGLTLSAFEARTTDQIDKAFADIDGAHAQALVILADVLMVTNEKKLGELTLKYRLPAIYGFRGFADAGGLVSYGSSLRDTYVRAASYADKILHGTSPGEIPIEQPTRFYLVVNLKTARTLGLTVPPSVLSLSDDVIE